MDKLQEVLQREPIERSILAGLGMRDPYWDAEFYIGMTLGPNKQETSPEMILYVRHQIEAACAADAGEDEEQFQAYIVGLNKIWPKLELKMMRSCGLAWYMMTTGCHSLFLPHYYATLYHPMALEAPRGWAIRLDGKFMQIPKSDPAYLLCVNEPIFNTARVRTAEQQLVQLELGNGANAVSLGAAMLPEYYHFAWQDWGVSQNVVAYDTAPGAEKFLKLIYKDKPLADYGIQYRSENYWNAFKDPDLQGSTDLVAMEGGLSYCKDRTGELLSGVNTLLRRGGYFCGEVELRHPYTIRCGCLGWQMDQPMQFDDNVESAIARIDAEAKQAGLKMVAANPDVRNEMPAMVWFQLQKI